MNDDTDLLSICAEFRADISNVLKTALEKSADRSGEQFLSEVLTGKCPGCGSYQTKNGEDEDSIGDFSVGLCIACGHLWCLDCGRQLSTDISCNHWDICRKCDSSATCNIVLSECKKLKNET